jgi:hypothetical protein
MYDPTLTYLAINKRNSMRIFEKDNGNNMNPTGGTILDYGIVEHDCNGNSSGGNRSGSGSGSGSTKSGPAQDPFDFYLIP